MRHSDLTSDQEEARSAVDELIKSALAYHTPERFRELIEFASRMPRIAPFNTMLLHVQNPGITYAATVTDWSKLGRKIKPGARPYIVLRFMGPVSFVFDIKDTYGSELPPSVMREIEDPFAVEGQVHPETWKKCLEQCPKMRIHVSECPLPTELAGDARSVDLGEYSYRIRLNVSHSTAARFATLAHELAHLFCGHCGKQRSDFWDDRSKLDLATRELEAEAVAYLVAKRRRLITASQKYLSLYLSPDSILPEFSMEHILTAAHAIEEVANGKVPSREKARKQRERNQAAKARAKTDQPTPATT